MEHLSELLSSIIPTFGVVGIGVLCRTTKIWDKSAVKVLNAYAFYIALPALIFQSLVTTDLARHLSVLDLKFVGGALAAHLVVFIVVLIVVQHRSVSKGTRAVAPMLFTFGSTAYLGIPYVTNTFGEAAVPYAAILSVALVIVLLFCSLAVLRRYGNPPDHQSFAREFFELPFLYAVLAGLAIAFFRIPLPHFIGKTIDVFAGSAGPTSLLALGAFDYGIKLRNIQLGPSVLFGAGKVFGTGLATFIILKLLGVTGLLLAVGTAMGAVSIAVTAFVLAEQHRAGETVTDSSMAVSSFCSFVALTVISFLWFSTGVFK